ncbi:MAG: YIP1 family protein [Deltaproteobacteria bacterium]|nr:MAG: YIP1 family protein [Deltaproteobacteria bacterium]
MSSLKDRMIRAAKLDATLYEEVEADTEAMGQAVGVVVLSSVAAGIGTITRGGFAGVIPSILLGTIFALIGWFVWAYLTYFIGTKFLPERQTKANLGELLRTIGFSSSPGLIGVLGVIPGLSSVVFYIASIWMLVAMVIAVKQALDFESTFRAFIVVLIGGIARVIIFALLFSILGGPPTV